ncbi:MAG: choice-of-anchor tandem repeat GloVer-containing protein [Rhizomicrobium sp.]
MVAGAIPSARSQTLNVVHNFTGGGDGGSPVDGFTMGPTGILYGTASAGGDSGYGVVFKITGKGKEAVLHSFAGGADGAIPNGGVLLDASGALFGTTTAGGASGSGTVFRINGKNESVLYSFAGGVDGADPQAALAMDTVGNLYGTTAQGGTSNSGTVFELVAPKKKSGRWKEIVLYSFGTSSDGATPVSGVMLDSTGNLYGTTSLGGDYGYGTVFKLSHGKAWTETKLHSFQNADDGAYPYAGVISDTGGNFYGATTQAGTSGGGTVFALTPSGGSLKFSVLTSLPGWGISGPFRNLMMDETGTIYGTTHCDGDDNAGTIFKLTPSGGNWTYALLYTFTGGTDGQFTISNLVSKSGKLYGTTIAGGANGAGVVYTLTP